ncbi:hypothetical protein ACFFHH_24245 [Cytobacillus solani]|uniref:Uncharacterized protein n=1 Tax=Cytobacillus solani TaxID=1637975 RepID=A0A0Q3SJ48_9BACI|nr:hypothetical protein [Cytobacillus solani]KOP82717.1 hypothetical protein AMS60_09635 [Bacillus sp. FJAT-21945]KQL19732.1 hypothetical protein AN957_14910 [Cytobacillus solani]
MIFVSEVMEKELDIYKSPLQEMVYESLTKFQLSFERVNTDEAISSANYKLFRRFEGVDIEI